MGAHRSRHSSASAGSRSVSEILARVTAGPGGSAALQSQRSAFAVAAAAAVGAGTAAAAVTGTFPAISMPSISGLTDTASHQIIEPAAVATPAPTQAGTAAMSIRPAASPSYLAAPPAAPAMSHTHGAAGGTVMAEDLHQSDASQIAALSHAMSVTKSVTQSRNASAPASLGNAGSAVTASNPAGGLLGGGLSGLLPSNIRGVPIAGLPASSTAATALKAAITKKGLPYIWGGTGPYGYDCSGLTQWAFKQVGITLPRTAAAQSRVGTPVSRSQLRPGDLVFFYSPVSHVGIYIGNNKIFNASETGQPLKVSDMSHMPFHNARRLT